MIDNIVDKYLNEARKKKPSEIAQYWMDYSENLSMADYYENEGERKGVPPAPYYKAAEKIRKEVEKKFGLKMSKAMEKHFDHMADYYYMGQGNKGAASKIRKSHGIDWDGEL